MAIIYKKYEQVARKLYPDAILLQVEPLAGGVSADVLRLDLRLKTGELRSIVMREHGPSHSGHSTSLEYQLLEALFRQGLPVPQPLCEDASCELTDNPFVLLSYVPGVSGLPNRASNSYLDTAAEMLALIHGSSRKNLPELPDRLDPLPEIFEYLPGEDDRQSLIEFLRNQSNTTYQGTSRLLHGDFWPQNIIWNEGTIAAVLDWEDAAIGDPLSDLACSRIEIRYQFGVHGMQRFTEAYQCRRFIDRRRLALWQIYVSAAAQHFMGKWGLPNEREAIMRLETKASIDEASSTLMSGEELI